MEYEKCEDCGKTKDVVRYRQNTMYANEEENWATLCPECKERNDEYWAEMWAEYYRNCM